MSLARRFCTVWDFFAKAPYAGVPVLVCLYVLILAVIFPANGPLTGHMIGFDDQTRMAQVLKFVNGGGWYDRTLMRVNAPEGFESIWSRIVDLPIAAVIFMAQQFVDQRTAALAATVIVPFAELILLFFVARYTAAPLVGKNESWLVVLFVMMTSVLNHQMYTFSGFHFGEASHHAWYIILNVLMAGACVRIVAGVEERQHDLWLAVAISLFLAVGIEGFPLIAGAAGILGLMAWAFNDPILASRSARAVAGGALLGLFMLPMHQPPTHLFDIVLSQPSILGPVLVGAAAGLLGLETVILRKWGRRKIISLIMLGLCAALLAGFLVFCFPQMLDGATAGLSPEERNLAATHHPEIWPLWQALPDNAQIASLTVPMFLALVAGLIGTMVVATVSARKRLWTYVGFAVLNVALAHIFWRYIHHAMVAICPLLLWFWQKTRWRVSTFVRNRGWRPIFYTIGACIAFFLIAPFWNLVVPILYAEQPLWQALVFPAKINLEPFRCDVVGFADYLNHHYSAKTKINVPSADTAAFLFQTQLKIDFLANFPSHNHFLDNDTFFQTQDLNAARDVARQHTFDLVGACKIIAMSPETMMSRPTRAPMLIETLTEGHPPAWLKPVPVGIDTDYVLYQVDTVELWK